MHAEEHCEAGRIVAAAYRALPGALLDDGYAALLADVGTRAAQADVLVAVTSADIGLLGCVTFVPDASSPWSELLEEGESGVRMLAVRPDAQRRGIGRALVRSCVERAAQLGSVALMLHTTPWMTAAHALYASAGFERFPERDWTPTPEVPLLAYRYLLR